MQENETQHSSLKHKSKKRINVGCLPIVTSPKLIQLLREEWPQQVLEYDVATSRFKPLSDGLSASHSVSSLLQRPEVSESEASFEKFITEACDELVESCTSLFQSIFSGASSFVEELSEQVLHPFMLPSQVDANQVEPMAEPSKGPRDFPTEVPTFSAGKAEEDFEFEQSLPSPCHTHGMAEWEVLDQEAEADTFLRSTEKDNKIAEDTHSPVPSFDISKYPDAYVMLISSRNRPAMYILPKGGLHKGEAACCGAMRECWEESGVTGFCSQKIQLKHAAKSDPDVLPTDPQAILPKEDSKHRKIKKWYWYLLQVTKIYNDWPEANQRSRIWIPVKDIDKFFQIRADARFILDSLRQSPPL